MNRPEENLHKACVQYLRASLPKPWLCWHTANGGGRSKAEAGILKAMGVLAGMPDLFVMGPKESMTKNLRRVGRILLRDGETPEEAAKELDGRFKLDIETGPFLIAIEFKAPPKRLRAGGASKARPRLSPAQMARQADLGACGVPYLVIDDMAEMVQALRALGVPLRGRAM